MIEFIFTLDYEIYGNGSGTLRDLVLDPTQQLAELLKEFDAPSVIFAEAVEFEKIEQAQSDPDIADVRAQMRQLRADGHEIALHLHPWFANGRYENGRWNLDWNERSFGALSSDRAETIVSDGIRYLRDALNDPGYSPVAFRAGMWAIQPAAVGAKVLARHGIRVDSSVFKGGRTSGIGLDYRPALRNGAMWRFSDDVTTPDPNGVLWEIPIYSQMVPFWQMLGSKRLKLQKKAQNVKHGAPLPRRWPDYLRLRYPRKLDFCRMTTEEILTTMSQILKEDKVNPEERRIIVAIGHSKDFVDSEPTRVLLRSLRDHSITITTFAHVFTEVLELSC